MGNILDILETPPAQTFVKVTFIEGFTLEADRGPRSRRRCPASAATSS